MRLPRTVHIIGLIMMLSMAAPVCRAQQTGFDRQVQKPVAESIRIRQETQKQEEQWRGDKPKLIARYEQLELEKKRLKTRKLTLEEQTSAAATRIAAKQKQLADIQQIQSRIAPLIESLVEQLRQHLTDDLAFLPEERRLRLERLDELRRDPDAALSEKFRKVMEALLVEAEYGNTIEVYQRTIAVEGRDMLVNIFRLGRIGLFFQTLDLKTCGFFDVAAATWQTLPGSYNRTIQAAMDIGAKRRPAEFLTLPLGRMRVQ